MGTGDITVTSSSYSGPAEGIEYLVFIDGNGSQVVPIPSRGWRLVHLITMRQLSPLMERLIHWVTA